MDNQLIDLLNAKAIYYEHPRFIDSDPIQIPKQFDKKEDIEIAGFIAALLAWGQRQMIIRKANEWMQAMDGAPHEFITQANEKEFQRFSKIIYRTMQGDDSLFIAHSLRNIYKNHGGLENLFNTYANDMKASITHFRSIFLETPHLSRSEKHLANPQKGSASKRINMFLRWMVRESDAGVDFGIWKSISPAKLMIPLDTHSGRVGRQLGLLHRKQDDWKSVEELTSNLRKLDPRDPVRYDFALFGMGVFK
jgi:uncharacterized protein (TIGR02757 family)